jgi:hypothetical protein
MVADKRGRSNAGAAKAAAVVSIGICEQRSVM